MKKVFFAILLFFMCLSVYAIKNVSFESHEFDSKPMLERFYKENTASEEDWDSVVISLITVSKSGPLYTWFGHTAILVEGVFDNGMIYDYGRFAFSDSFYRNFAMGRLWYNCSAVYSSMEFESFRQEGRTVSKVVLNLKPSQKQAILNFLEINSSGKYNTYLYHHYNDNCATRIRDLINEVTNGDFKAWATSQKGFTFRKDTSRILFNNIFINWALDFLQSGNIDRQNTRWEDMFLPNELEKALLDYNGEIVGKHSYVVDSRSLNSYPANFENPQSYFVHSLCFGLLLALLASILRKNDVLAAVYISFINVIIGLLGSLLFFMMFFTSHDVTWNNENILFINPSLLVCAVLSVRYYRHKNILKWFYAVLSAIAVILCALKLIFPGVFVQQNWSQIFTVLPLYIVLSI